MTHQITLTIPLEKNVLERMSGMLANLADDITEKELIAGTEGATVSTPEAKPGAAAVKSAKEVFGSGEGTDKKTEATTAPPPPPPPAAAAPLNNVKLDNDGLPWDARIHSAGKSKLVKTGCWKKKRGVAVGFVTNVEAELRTALAVPADTQPGAIVNPPLTGAIATFPELMAAITAKNIDLGVVQQACTALGIASLPLMANRPDLIPTLATNLGL